MTLETPRLRLRRWRDEDYGPFAALNADPEVTEFLGGRYGRDESDALAAHIARHHDAHGFGPWAVEIRDGPAFVGFVGLMHVAFEAPFTPAVEIGWRLARPVWGRGIATEAARRALEHADHIGVGPIVSFTSLANERSRAVMARVGLVRDLDGDFDHPALPERHPLRRHALYRRPG